MNSKRCLDNPEIKNLIRFGLNKNQAGSKITESLSRLLQNQKILELKESIDF